MTPIKEQAVELIGRLTEEDTVFIVRIMENLEKQETDIHERDVALNRRQEIVASLSGILPSSVTDEEVRGIRGAIR